MGNTDFSLHEKIIALRKKRGLSQEAMAEAAEMKARTYQNIEIKRTKKIDIEYIIQIADAFGMTVDELVRDPSTKKPPEIVESPMAPVMKKLEILEGKLDQKNGPSMDAETEALVALILRLPKDRIPSLTKTVQAIIDKAPLDQSKVGPTRNSK